MQEAADRPRPISGCLMMDDKVQTFVDMLTSAGCDVAWDRDAGTVEANEEDGPIVFRAICKGGRVWIAMFYNSERISWAKEGS